MLKANTDFYLLNRFHVTDACQLTTGFCENKTRGGFTRQLAKGTKFCSPLFHAVNGETTSTRSAIRSAKLDLYRAARMVTAKIKISVKGAAIFSRKQLPPCFEYRLQPASEDCGPRKTRPLKTTPHGVLAHYWFVFRTLLWRDIGCVEGWAAVPTFYVNTADTQGSQMAVNRSKCDITRALSNSDRSISTEVCGVADWSVGSDRSSPAAILSNHLGYLRVTQSGGKRVRRWEEIKGNLCQLDLSFCTHVGTPVCGRG